MASIAPLPQDSQELPVLLEGTADEELNTLATSTNPIYVYEQVVTVAMVATIFQLREQLTGRRAILFACNEAACAAIARGAAKNKGALLFVYALWAIAARRDIGLWTARVLTEANAADPPPRDRDLLSETGPAKELAPLKDILPIYDFS